ncbi:RNA polymerase sigma factor [Paenibacillus sp. 22594]|uniref:RNA polymerase sigma factor n=1 Tax=Paenibacillus sp. 22594 TaxID=3453947 RepID=UPI003F846420
MDQWIGLLRTNIKDLDPSLQELTYRSFYHFIYKDIYFLVRDHSSTQDIIQETFIKLVQLAPKAHTANIPSWIRRVSRNMAIDYLRKNKSYRYIFNTELVNTVAASSSIAHEVEDKLRNDLLHQIINELKPEYRILLLLYYMEDRSYKEISQELKLTETVVTQRLARARKKLLQEFSRRWADIDE